MPSNLGTDDGGAMVCQRQRDDLCRRSGDAVRAAAARPVCPIHRFGIRHDRGGARRAVPDSVSGSGKSDLSVGSLRLRGYQRLFGARCQHPAVPRRNVPGPAPRRGHAFDISLHVLLRERGQSAACRWQNRASHGAGISRQSGGTRIRLSGVRDPRLEHPRHRKRCRLRPRRVGFRLRHETRDYGRGGWRNFRVAVLSGLMVAQNLDAFVGWLKSQQRRLDISDQELMDLFWRVHPRLRFLKSLPWSVNLIDIGAGSGGLAHWRHWGKPDRADLTLYGVDRSVGEHAGLYGGWEAINLDRQMPEFPGVKLNGFFASHLLEYLGAPEALIEWMGTRAEPGARVYLEWTNPISLDLPTREQLQKHDIEVLTSNFIDDWEHKQAPDLARLSGWLKAAGFELISSGAIDLGILGEELFARGADRDSRTMGYWSMTRSSLYATAVKAGEAARAAQQTTPITRTSRAPAEQSEAPAAAKVAASEDLSLLRVKRAL